MASIVIRQLEDQTKALLKASVHRHGRAVEGAAIHRRFAALGGIVLPEFPSEPISPACDLNLIDPWAG